MFVWDLGDHLVVICDDYYTYTLIGKLIIYIVNRDGEFDHSSTSIACIIGTESHWNKIHMDSYIFLILSPRVWIPHTKMSYLGTLWNTNSKGVPLEAKRLSPLYTERLTLKQV